MLGSGTNAGAALPGKQQQRNHCSYSLISRSGTACSPMCCSPFLLSAKALLDAVPCDVDALHGFDIAASVGVGALGGFSVGLARFLEGRAPFGVDGGEVLLYRWGSAPREWIVFGSVVAAAVIAARASPAA